MLVRVGVGDGPDASGSDNLLRMIPFGTVASRVSPSLLHHLAAPALKQQQQFYKSKEQSSATTTTTTRLAPDCRIHPRFSHYTARGIREIPPTDTLSPLPPDLLGFFFFLFFGSLPSLLLLLLLTVRVFLPPRWGHRVFCVQVSGTLEFESPENSARHGDERISLNYNALRFTASGVVDWYTYGKLHATFTIILNRFLHRINQLNKRCAHATLNIAYKMIRFHKNF